MIAAKALTFQMAYALAYTFDAVQHGHWTDSTADEQESMMLGVEILQSLIEERRDDASPLEFEPTTDDIRAACLARECTPDSPSWAPELQHLNIDPT